MKDNLIFERAMSYTNDELCAIIDNCINGKNAERNRKILKRRLIDGICYEPLAEEFNLSVRQTQNIIYNGMNKLLLVI